MKRGTTIAALVAAVVLAGHAVEAQVTPSLLPLSQVPIPKPDKLGDYVKNEQAAIALGKSLFWDMQLGVDGIQSCASCHFHAGADNRSKNQLNPGEGDIFDIGDRPNYQLQVGDFPFHKLTDPNNRSSTVVSDSNDVTGSQGVFRSDFEDVVPGSDKDNVTPQNDEVFNVQGTNVRQVTGRNTPTVINAVFNFRNFWDGRAQNIFNGVNEFGLRDPNAYVLKAPSPQRLKDVPVSLNNSSLASQAVGPPLSALETAAGDLPIASLTMLRVDASETNDTIRVSDTKGKEIAVLDAEGQTISGSADLSPSRAGATNANNQNASNSANSSRRRPPRESSFNKPFRRFGRKLGKKLLSLRPLAKQLVARDDSVLGPYSLGPERGLNQSYESLIQDAFRPEWWNSNLIIRINPETGERRFSRKPRFRPLNTNEYTLMEYNFALFFGLAVQAYESTLISDQTPFDQFLANPNTNALTDEQKRGWQIFQNQGRCIGCHGGTELTSASVSSVASLGRIRRSPRPPNPPQDTGFFNIGVRPTEEDFGVGGNDKPEFGNSPLLEPNPLSEVRLAQQGKFKDLLGEDPPPLNPSLVSDEHVVADGAFKTPGLRNVELTAPYFHNGGQLTLEQVVDFYNRGGDFEGFQGLLPLNLTPGDKQDLVAFLKALTDERVRYQRAPFDHPQLFVPNGHPGDQNAVAIDPNVQSGNGTKQATDALLEIPAVGRNGGNPLPNFLGTYPMTGATFVR